MIQGRNCLSIYEMCWWWLETVGKSCPGQWAFANIYQCLEEHPISEPHNVSFLKEKWMCKWNALRLHMWNGEVRINSYRQIGIVSTYISNQFMHWLIIVVEYVLAMSPGQGHVLKSQGQNEMADHILCNFCSDNPQCVLAVSHTSSLPPVTKTCESSKSSKLIFWSLAWFLCWRYPSQILFLEFQNQF